ncbi:MAG: hypothetical protein OXP12_01095, partial [Thaumarchaeota archaeon]|nr:hypothetical protein [Nitrososphaerota archaeon]
NVANATQTVTVRDTTPPAIVPAAVGAAEATGPTTAVSVPLPAVSDNHDGAGQITIRTNVTGAHTVVTSAVSHAFAVGTHTVHWSATDTSGNVANATQTVTVRDTTPPAWYANRPQSPDAEASPAAAVNALDAERKQLHETFKELKKDIKRMRASVGEALDGIAGSDKRYAKQQKEIASLEKALDKARAEKRLKKDLLEFYVNPERVFRDHGADGRTGNHVLAFLPGHAPGCDGAAPGGPCISPSIHAGRDKSRPMALGDIRDLGFWPNRTVHSGDTFEWTYPAGVEMGAVTVTAPDGSRAEASPGHHDPPINGTSQSLHGPGSQSHTFDAPGVFRWDVEGHPATSGIITVVEAPPLRSLLGGAGADATGAQNAEQSGIAILERKIALWNEKIDALRDVEKDLRKILKSARSGGLDLGDLHLMSLAEINDLSKAAKDVKKRTIRLDDVLRYHAQPGHVFSDHGRNEETGNHVIELSRDCGGDENGYCLSPDVFKQMRDGKRPALTKIGHLGLWPDRSIWSGETVEWSYHGAGTHGGGMAQETITITAPDGTKSKTSPGSPGGAGGKAAPQIHTFADAGRYAWLLDGNPNVNGTISVERAK